MSLHMTGILSMRLQKSNLIVAVIVFVCLLVWSPVFSQLKRYPSGEFNAGFSLLGDSDLTAYGFHTGIHAGANNWFGMEAQFDGLPEVTDSDAKFFVVTGGPRFSWRLKNLTPFTHFLVGGFFSRLHGEVDSHFAMKAGGGVQVSLSKKFAWQVEANDLILLSPEKHFYHFATGLVYRWY